jgi:hypothetical protein
MYLGAASTTALKRKHRSTADTCRDSLYSECATRVQQQMPAKRPKANAAGAALEDSLMLGSLPAVEE